MIKLKRKRDTKAQVHESMESLLKLSTSKNSNALRIPAGGSFKESFLKNESCQNQQDFSSQLKQEFCDI